MGPLVLYDNRFNDSTPTASSTDGTGGFDVAHLLDWRPYTWWKPAALPATVTIDCGTAKAADYLFIYGHDLGTQSATLEIRYSTDNFVTDDNLAATLSPSDDLPKLARFTSQTKRYWRLRIPSGAVDIPSLAIAVAGAGLEIPGSISDGFDPAGRRSQGQFNRSVAGHPLGRAIDFDEWTQDVSIQWLSRTWLDSNFAPAWSAHLRSSPFGFAWDAEGHVDDLFLVNTDGRFETPHHAGDYVDLKISLAGVYPYA
jgi:hypothetical protein